MQHRRACLGRLYRIEQRFKLFVFDFNQFQSLLGRQSGFGRDRRHLLADKPHHSIRQHRRVVNAAADPHSGNILPGNHRSHSRNLPRFTGIDAFDATIGNRAPQAPAPQNIRKTQIRAVKRFACDFELTLDPRRRSANHLRHLVSSRSSNV